MTAPSASGHLADAATPPELMDANNYAALLTRLVTQGQGHGKTESVAAYKLPGLRIITETSSGQDEVTKDIPFEPHYIVMDTSAEAFNTVAKRDQAIRDVFIKFGSHVVNQEEINAPSFKGAGLWTSKARSFEEDYNPTADKTIYDPDPEAYRVCLRINENIKIPTQWGEFTIEAGGTLAIREKDIPALTKALQKIKPKGKTAAQALLNEDGSAIFDVYGMEPGFLEKNYAPVELKPETLSHARDLISTGVSEKRAPK